MEKRGRHLVRDLLRSRYLYLMLLPALVFFLVFRYVPMYGVVIAFQEFSIFKGVDGSPWVGLLQFKRLFNSPIFTTVFLNTLIISFLKLVAGFIAPLTLALLLNELRNALFKRFTQTVLYIPYFISWVIMAGLIQSFLNPDTGVVTDLIRTFGGKPVNFFVEKDYFVSILVITDLYKNVGWGTIIYLAAFSSVPLDLYEASLLDGGGRLRQVWHITLPSIKNIIVILLILSLGNILNAGFDQVFLLYNPMVYEVGDIIDTYVYRKGIVETNYSLSAAAGLFKSVVSLVLIVGANWLAKRFGEEGVW